MSTSQTTQKIHVPFLHSISLRLSLAIIMAIIFIVVASIAVVYYIGRPKMTALSDRYIKEQGHSALAMLSSDMQYVNGLVNGYASMQKAIPLNKDKQLEIGNAYWSGSDPRIAVGSVEFEPYMFGPQHERMSISFARSKDGKLEQDDSYNNPEEEPIPYYQQGYYVAGIVNDNPDCTWVPASIETGNKEVVSTCSKAFRINDKVAGIVTVDIQSSSHLKAITERIQKEVGGYAFILDINNRFLTFPNITDVTKQANRFEQSRLTASEYASKHKDFQPVSEAINSLSAQMIQQSRQKYPSEYKLYHDRLINRLAPNEFADQDIDLLAANIVEQAHPSGKKGVVYRQISIAMDPVLKQPATAYIFVEPETDWKVVIVKPVAEITASSNQLAKALAQLLSITVLGLGLVMLLLAWFGVARPLRKTSARIAELAHMIQNSRFLEMKQLKLKVRGRDEVAVVGRSVNQLVDRIVQTEGRMANLNEELEQTVREQTQDLRDAMQELKQSQLQLVNSEKMALLGQMVAGVAHEVNTPLGYIKSNVMLTQEQLQELQTLQSLLLELHQKLESDTCTEDQLFTVIQQIDALSTTLNDEGLLDGIDEQLKDTLYGIEQISDLVLSLKNFARLDESKTKAVNIEECLESSLKITQHETKHAHIVRNYAKDLPLVTCAPSQLNQVLMNLLNNAAHAMGHQKGATITVTTRAIPDAVEIDIADNGPGIVPELQERIFEPFFTTKPAGVGTGLGLAICRQIMEQHQGKLTVRSNPENGTCFTITLPLQGSIKI